MSAEDLLLPSAKKGSVDANCEINKLADADLMAIFKWLPPYDRLLVSEVCKRWHAVASNSWLDVTDLDVSSIPLDNIAAIVRRCPNLRVVSAIRKTLRLSELRLLSRLSLRAVKLYDCMADVCATEDDHQLGDPSCLFSGISDAAWDALVLHDCLVRPSVPAERCAAARPVPSTWPDIFPAGLKRLQITRATEPFDERYMFKYIAGERRDFGRWFRRLPPLECLLLHETVYQSPDFLTDYSGALRNLRELCLASDIVRPLWQALMNLPSLQTLFLHDCYWPADGDFDKLVTKHPSLRIVAFTGIFNFHKEFPMRVRYANGYNSDPLPVLHVFVGKWASESIRFPIFPSDAAKVYPISEPLPQFLEREDIAPIFEGVWIAEKIKEAAKTDSVLYTYGHHVATSFRSVET